MSADKNEDAPATSAVSRRGLLAGGVGAATAVLASTAGGTASAAPRPAGGWTVDLSGPATPFPHYWEGCIGGDHAKQALRRDYQDQLVRAHHDLGVSRLRMHGIFDPQMSTYSADRTPSPYSFFNHDQIYDFLVGSGMQPYVEIGFMPAELAADPTKTGFYYQYVSSPPSDYDAWARLVSAFTRHLVDRYGIHEVRQWPFEVWNEPNIGFWSGTQDEYMKLYRYTVDAIKNVDASLQVGGPATDGEGLAFVEAFLDFTGSERLPVDFVSTHAYENNSGSGANGVADIFRPVKDLLPHAVPHYVSETGANYSYGSEQHDTSYAAASWIKAVDRSDGVADLMSLWCFSDIFEEVPQASREFNGAYGIQTIHGIAKPVYRAFQMLKELGTERLPVTGIDPHGTTGALAVTSHGHDVDVLLYNHAYPGGPEPRTETVTVTVRGVPSGALATLARIDDAHADPRQKWIEQGSPLYPTARQIDAMADASEVHPARLTPARTAPGMARDTQDLTFRISVPAEGVAALRIA